MVTRPEGLGRRCPVAVAQPLMMVGAAAAAIPVSTRKRRRLSPEFEALSINRFSAICDFDVVTAKLLQRKCRFSSGDSMEFN
jgi:hypothetical protein